MKFLTVSKIKDVFYTLPQAQQNKLLIAAVESLLAYKKKMRDKWHFYNDPGGNNIISIGEYDSFEEYAQSLQSPAAISGYMYHESTPLIEMDEKVFKAWLDSQKSAKKK